MPSLATDSQGFLRFAAISDTWLGSRTARPEDLEWFLRGLPDLGISTVLHLGGAVGLGVEPPIAYPQVEGITTYELGLGLLPALEPRLCGNRRDDVVGTGPTLKLTHGAHRGSSVLASCSTDLLLLRSPHLKFKTFIRDTLHAMQPPAITLVGGARRVSCKYYDHDRAFIGTVGVFSAPPNTRNPPLVYGGTIVEVKLNDDGSLDTCVIRFRDMSGRLPDTVKEVTNHGDVAA
jgi:hypothetical protein